MQHEKIMSGGPLLLKGEKGEMNRENQPEDQGTDQKISHLKRREILYFFLASQILALLCLLPMAAGAADVSGTLEINKKKFKLAHGYIDMVQPEEPVIVLSDKPLPEEQVPFLNADYAVKNKVHAVVFGIISKDKKISDMRWVYLGGDGRHTGHGVP